MKITDDMKNNIKEHYGYTDEELETLFENPRNIEAISKSLGLLDRTIVIEVVCSHGCTAQHKIGDKFYFNGIGQLLTRYCPKKICIYALSALDHLIFAANELYYAGVDSNEMRFKRADCKADVGLKCGGFGKIVMEIKVEDRKKIQIGK